MSNKYVYSFGKGKSDGEASMKELLGGKGANLAEMSNLGVPVPAGFTISTEVCTDFYANNGEYKEEVKEQVKEGINHIETQLARFQGCPPWLPSMHNVIHSTSA